jgi:hypothetical protein
LPSPTPFRSQPGQPFDAGVVRINFSPGEYRDLSKPLVEVDREAPRRIRTEQRFTRAVVWTLLSVGVTLNALLLLAVLIIVFTNG